jgi:hypothetical protein
MVIIDTTGCLDDLNGLRDLRWPSSYASIVALPSLNDDASQLWRKEQ